MQRRAFGSFQYLCSVFYTMESQAGEIIAALLSLKTESKGKRFFF